MVIDLGQVYLMKIALHRQTTVPQPLGRSMTNGILHLLRNLCASQRHVIRVQDRGIRRPLIRDLQATQVQAMNRYLTVEVALRHQARLRDQGTTPTLPLLRQTIYVQVVADQ